MTKKKILRFAAAALIGTSAMTLYSYILSKKNKQQFTEPVLLNQLMNRSSVFPELPQTKSHPAGWAGHYAVGLLFVIAYYLLWRRALNAPSVAKALAIGCASGAVAIAAWYVMFAISNNPPQNNRKQYFGQLFVAHLIFSLAAIYSYRLPDRLHDELVS